MVADLESNHLNKVKSNLEILVTEVQKLYFAMFSTNNKIKNIFTTANFEIEALKLNGMISKALVG